MKIRMIKKTSKEPTSHVYFVELFSTVPFCDHERNFQI